MATSRICMNFHEEAEAPLNKQINIEVYASHVYLSTAFYSDFKRDDQAFHGFAKYF
jgi:ferritin